MKPRKKPAFGAAEKEALVRKVDAARQQKAPLSVQQREQIARIALFYKDLRERIIAQCFDRQREVVASDRMFIAMLCGRRSGKTMAIVYMILLALLEAGSNEHVVYCAPSARKGIDIIWKYLLANVKEFGLDQTIPGVFEGWTVNASDHSIDTPAGGRFWIFGISEERRISNVRGNKYRLFVCDEVQAYQEFLDELIEEAVIPALGEAADAWNPDNKKSAGKLVLSGTPTGVLAGMWFKISTGRGNTTDTPEHERWLVKSWTMVENPHHLDPVGWMAMTRRRKGWSEDHHQYVQEYLARWVRSETQLVVPRYEPVDPVPTAGLNDWVHWMSTDHGYSPHPSAIVVVAKRRREPARVVYGRKFGGEADPMDEVRWSDEVKKVYDRFRPVSITGDTAGGGSRAVALYNQKFGQKAGVWITAADKSNKPARIDFLNTDLGRKSLVIERTAETADLRGELDELVWRDGDRKVFNALCEDHAFDALSYCHMQVHDILEKESDQLTRRAMTNEEAHREMLEEMAAMQAAAEEQAQFNDSLDMWSSSDFLD